jgi:hypothetical protein
MTVTQRVNLVRNAEEHIRALTAVIDLLVQSPDCEHELAATSRALSWLAFRAQPHDFVEHLGPAGRRRLRMSQPPGVIRGGAGTDQQVTRLITLVGGPSWHSRDGNGCLNKARFEPPTRAVTILVKPSKPSPSLRYGATTCIGPTTPNAGR